MSNNDRSKLDFVGRTPPGKLGPQPKQGVNRYGRGKPVFPDRESTIDLGRESIAVRRGGSRGEVTADELIIDALIVRALKGDLPSVRELYVRLDREEDAAIANPPVVVSAYIKRKIKDYLKKLIRAVGEFANELYDAGLVDVVDGKMVVSKAARGGTHEARKAH